MELYNTSKQNRLDQMGAVQVVGDEQKVIDIKLAVYIVVHSALKSIDHLTELLKIVGKGSRLERLRLHRTKCSKLIVNVVAPAMLTALVEDLSDSVFSLIVDESTDISTTKFLATMIKYYSKTDNVLKTEFLGLIGVYRATADALWSSLKEHLTGLGINYQKQCKGLGTDGASTLCGGTHSVFTLMKAEIPDLQIVKCVCHSLHNAASKAAAEMPADVEFLVRETRNWFSRSPLKRLQYKDLYAAINGGAMPRALVQLVRTRWLAWAKAISVVTDQWLELKQHFVNHNASMSPSEKCAIGRKLYECFQQDAILFYLKFLGPITKELNALNLRFQATDGEV
ncbi:Zinc finger protein 862 [Frankliniella fusca]|uniref:Zinc finger protein 862 n=1 Tax=Frankliniella fusca TaxID=407009 RepID=A0AAE1HN39_9NEOP|nr:Zinc finger protein 862 [Frankliniella fusca]KAK3924377.1 Zinc finger protein 862 [Frankliniella fusca]